MQNPIQNARTDGYIKILEMFVQSASCLSTVTDLARILTRGF